MGMFVAQTSSQTQPSTFQVSGSCDYHVTTPSSTGCGDFSLSSVTFLPDPCPLPDKTKKRSLNEKEKMIYAPMAGVGGIIYDKVLECADSGADVVLPCIVGCSVY